MRLPSRHRPAPLPGVTGVARVDRRIATVARRARPGDIAVVDHLDLDRASAQALLDAGVSAVLNVAPSISGRYPALGPQLLVDAGVALVDRVGPELFAYVRDGEVIRLDEDTVYDTAAQPLLRGVRQTPDAVADALAAARAGLAAQLAAFTAAASGHLVTERDLIVDGVGLPDLADLLAGRPAVVVHPATDAAATLTRLRGYLRRHHPVLIGVDTGADALLAAGLPIDLLVTGADPEVGAESVAAAERIVCTASAERLRDLGRAPTPVLTRLGPADVALLLGVHGGASLVVRAGGPREMTELLETGAGAAAAAFLAQVRASGRLVDADAVAALCPPVSRVRVALRILAVLLLVAAVVGAVATAAVWGRGYSPWTPVGWTHLWHRLAADIGVL